jgi:hypothetical protein
MEQARQRDSCGLGMLHQYSTILPADQTGNGCEYELCYLCGGGHCGCELELVVYFC